MLTIRMCLDSDISHLFKALMECVLIFCVSYMRCFAVRALFKIHRVVVYTSLCITYDGAGRVYTSLCITYDGAGRVYTSLCITYDGAGRWVVWCAQGFASCVVLYCLYCPMSQPLCCLDY